MEYHYGYLEDYLEAHRSSTEEMLRFIYFDSTYEHDDID